jgi:large subunit ribosomal protein L29
LATAELAERLAEEKANYMSMKLTHSLSPLENPMQIKVARKNIARLSTELSTRSTEE